MCEICRRNPCASGCPNGADEIIGECAQCNEEIKAGYEYCKDGEDNLFCALDCALDYYGIEEMEI